MAKEVIVDQDSSIACGICVENLPGVFHFTDDGKAQCFDPDGASEEEIQQQAIDVCPVNCISWK